MRRLLEKMQVRKNFKSRSACLSFSRREPPILTSWKTQQYLSQSHFFRSPHSSFHFHHSDPQILAFHMSTPPKLQKQKAVVSSLNLSCLCCFLFCFSLFLSGLPLIVLCYKLSCISFGLKHVYKFVSKALHTNLEQCFFIIWGF